MSFFHGLGIPWYAQNREAFFLSKLAQWRSPEIGYLNEPYRSIDIRSSSMECFFQVLITLAGALCFTLLLGAVGQVAYEDGWSHHQRSKVEMLQLGY